MKYPLKWYHRLGREMLCTLLTHRWKTSWHRRDDYDWAAEHYKELPYGRRNSGNGLYEFSETWQYKCRRCRQQHRTWHPTELRLQLYYGVVQAFRNAAIGFAVYPWHKALLLAPVSMLNDFFIHQEWIWPTVRFAPTGLYYYVMEKIEP